jgi:hypothetical protein
MSAELTAPGAVVFTDTVLRRFLFGVVLVMTGVVCGVAAAAFWTSFEAIRAFAERSGGINPEHAWLAPLLVDSFIFVASAADLWCSATGAARSAEGFWQRAVTWLPKALLGVAAGGSFALNIAHAPTHLGARVVAALAPAALVLNLRDPDDDRSPGGRRSRHPPERPAGGHRKRAVWRAHPGRQDDAHAGRCAVGGHHTPPR